MAGGGVGWWLRLIFFLMLRMVVSLVRWWCLVVSCWLLRPVMEIMLVICLGGGCQDLFCVGLLLCQGSLLGDGRVEQPPKATLHKSKRQQRATRYESANRRAKTRPPKKGPWQGSKQSSGSRQQEDSKQQQQPDRRPLEQHRQQPSQQEQAAARGRNVMPRLLAGPYTRELPIQSECQPCSVMFYAVAVEAHSETSALTLRVLTALWPRPQRRRKNLAHTQRSHATSEP
ncbi:unnamed protein product [Symbiodinium sp. KB8]|nr:unnamed protein product [Symbiodinium sp. KB8]